MNKPASGNAIWFVYDGECPLCTRAAQVLRIKKEYGELHLINAREAKDIFLIKEIARRGLDLDEGMVIYAGARFYHGKDALRFMARYGETENVAMLLCRTFFRSGIAVALAYPVMRTMRNFVLRSKGVGRIKDI